MMKFLTSVTFFMRTQYLVVYLMKSCAPATSAACIVSLRISE